MKLRSLIIVATLALALGAVNWLAFGRERLATNGQPIFLALAPVDPRSLMQGDYMRLRYALANDVPTADLPADGALVVRLDGQGVASFSGFHTPGRTLGSGEHLLRYRLRDNGLRLGAEEFFFQEGQADLYAEARYAELRVDSSGDALLIGLRGASLEPLGPPR